MAATPEPSGASHTRRLIVSADDFALSPAVTDGILRAHAAGVVTATSMMVRCPGWDDGVRRALATPTLDVGLHLNLLVGSPLARAPSLTGRDGAFLSLAALARRALLGRVRMGEVAAECEAQLAALGEAGIRVTHIDSHRHTHALPAVCAAVARVAAAHRLVLRRPVEPGRLRLGAGAGRLRSALVAWSWRAASAGIPSVTMPDHCAGLSLRGGPDFAASLAGVVDALPFGTTELVVHPGSVDDALARVDGYTAGRESELRALTDAALRDRLRERGVDLVSFRDL
ncbi:MAG TPA: ChbG/HpnK family deacetylase [Gemmatimonadaceae bacterium]